MAERQFEQAVQLFKTLGETRFWSGQNLMLALCLASEISLWEVVAPYLVLYRFPLLFPSDGQELSWRQFLEHRLRPYLGLMRHFRETVLLPPQRNTIACEQWCTEEPVVLFLGFPALFYQNVLHPVADLVTRQRCVQGVVVDHSPHLVASVNEHSRLRFESCWGHWGYDSEHTVRAMLSHLRAIQKILLNHTQFMTFLQDAKVSLNSSALHHEFEWLFWREFRRLIPQIATASHILDRHRPALIVSADNADSRCRVYSLLGRSYGIPSLIVQQGFTSPKYPDWYSFSADAVAAMGQTSRATLITQGVLAEQITVTGHPGFDCLVTPEPEVCARVRTDLGVKDGQSMVLFASQPYYIGTFHAPEMRQAMIKAIVKAVSVVENVLLVVKPHPSDDIRELRALVGTHRRIIMVDRTMDISALITACDILITFFSQTALQALFAGKPVINVAFPGSGGASLYVESGATWVARSTDEVVTHLRSLTGAGRSEEMAERDAARQRFVFEWAHMPDGCATARVVDLIGNMVDIS